MAIDRRSGRSRRSLRPRYLAVAGFLLFIAGVVAFMGIITAEALYPEGYSTSGNAISDLGATEPPDSRIEEPSATIFNSAMMAAGVLILVASFCVQRGFGRWAAPILIALYGIGVLGVGVFPGDHGTIHALFALLTFIAGGLAAIVSLTILTPPFSYFAVILGLVALVTLLLYFVLGDSSPMAGLGMGGVERWVAYPVLLWTMGLGGYLMGRAR
jgi:hypothetical membrane protein